MCHLIVSNLRKLHLSFEENKGLGTDQQSVGIGLGTRTEEQGVVKQTYLKYYKYGNSK